VRKVTRT